MRSLSAAVLAAQKSPAAIPVCRAQLRNRIRDNAHYQWAEVDARAADDNKHDAAGSPTELFRLRILNNGNLERQQTPLATPNFGSAWTLVQTSVDSCAIATMGANHAMIVFGKGTGLWWSETTNAGVSWSTPVLLSALLTQCFAIATAYYNGASGDNCVIFESGNGLHRFRRVSGTWGASITWPHTVNQINGLSTTGFGDFDCIVTGKDASNRPTLWSLTLGNGFGQTVDTWSGLRIIQQAEADELITFHAPSLTVADTYRLMFSEHFSGTPAYARTFWSYFSPGQTFAENAWSAPMPLPSTFNYGFAFAHHPTSIGHIYLSNPAQVFHQNYVEEFFDIEDHAVHCVIDWRNGLDCVATLTLLNDAGQYAGPPSRFQLGRSLNIDLSYGPPDNVGFLNSSAHRLTIVDWEYGHHAGHATFTLHLRGNAWWLDTRPRTTTTRTGEAFTQVLRYVSGQAGLEFGDAGASVHAQQDRPTYTVHPHQTHRQVLDALFETIADVALDRGFNFVIIEPLASNPSAYTFGTDHAIYTNRTRREITPGAAEIIGVDRLGQAFDFFNINSDRTLAVRVRDPHAATTAWAEAHAAARLRKAVLNADLGELTVPPHIGLDPNDVISYEDPLVSASPLTARVRSVRTEFRRPPAGAAKFEQRIGLGGV